MTYRFVRGLMRLALLGFFRRVEIQGEEQIPATGPVLLVANHTNAFVDPLIVLTGHPRRITLTAKATLAKNPLLLPVIKGLGVILLHRASDRVEGAVADRNAGPLSACVTTLREGGALFIFPEGVSHSDPGMRAFKRGAALIAADFLEAEPERDLQIVPVGLHFSKKDRWRSEAVALIGTPVSARAWVRGDGPGAPGRPAGRRELEQLEDPEQMEDLERPGVADGRVDIRALTDAMRGWVESLTVNFSSEAERELLSRAERLMAYRVEGPGPLDRPPTSDARARVDLVHRLQSGAHELRSRDPDRFAALADEARSLERRLEDLGVDVAEVSLSMGAGRAALFVVRELEVLLVGAPLAFVGWLVHLPPLTLTRRLVEKMSEDEDHPASNAVFLSLPIFGFWWLAVGIVTGLASSSWGWGVFCVLASVFAGAVHLHYRDRAGSVARRIRTFLIWLRGPDLREGLQTDIEAWHEEVRAIGSELPGDDRSNRGES